MMAPWWVPRGPRSAGCRSWTSWAPAVAERDGPGVGVAVGVAGVGQDVAEADAVWSGIAVSTGTRARAGSWRQEQTVIRRASSGTGGPCSSRIMVAAEA